MNRYFFEKYFELIYPSQLLPSTLILLDEWIFITIKGKDAIKYLQTQLTFDLIQLKKEHFAFSAHCNERGKVIGILHIFKYKNGIAYVIRKSIYQKHILALKKYAIFSDISISVEKEKIIFGLTGFHFLLELKDCFFLEIPQKIQNQFLFEKEDILGLYFSNPIPRIMLISSYENFSKIKKKIRKKIKNWKSSDQWTSLDIESGFPIIDKFNSEKFIPQSINLNRIHGISFKKGCYIGQEIIAKIEYKKINKQSLYWLVGTSNCIPNVGDILEIEKADKTLCEAGYILAMVLSKEKEELWIQAVIKNKFAKKEVIFLHTKIQGKFFINF